MSQQNEFDPDTSANHRKNRSAAVDFAVWSKRLARLLQTQPGVLGNIVISDMRVPSVGGNGGTLMFTADFDSAGGRDRQELVLRYATADGLFHSYDLPGQYAILKGLQGTDVPIPNIAGIDVDGRSLGVVGYLMVRVDGDTAPASYYKAGLMLDATPKSRKQMILGTVAAQAQLHALDWKTLGIDFLTTRGQGSSALERDIDWLWSSLAWGCPNELQGLESTREWFLHNQPIEDYICLCHGDSMLPNYMFRDDKLTAILDWELAFLGNPTNDVAYQAFTHSFLGLGCPPLEGSPSTQERKDEYERASGRQLDHWNYFYTVAAFKVHMSMLLVLRNAPPEMEPAKRAALNFTWQSILDGQASCRNQQGA